MRCGSIINRAIVRMARSAFLMAGAGGLDRHLPHYRDGDRRLFHPRHGGRDRDRRPPGRVPLPGRSGVDPRRGLSPDPLERAVGAGGRAAASLAGADRAGGLVPGLPQRDMLVSPQHRLLLAGEELALLCGTREGLAPALHLMAGPTSATPRRLRLSICICFSTGMRSSARMVSGRKAFSPAPRPCRGWRRRHVRNC